MIKAYINGYAYELDATYTISEQAANKIASDIAIYVEDGQPIPQSGDIIEIKDEDTVYFLGVCGIPKSPKFSSPHNVRKYSLTCSNANGILGRRVANVAYKNYTISQIVLDLFSKYIESEGFTLGTISDIPIVVNIYTAADYGLQFVLDELAEYVNGVWMCTDDRVFHFLAQDDFPLFPQEITREFIPITDLQVSVKDTDLRTNQIISGATSRTDEQTERFLYDGENNIFIVSFGIAQKPTILVNGIEIDPDKIGVNGLDSNSPNLMFLFSFNSVALTYNDQFAGEPLMAGNTVVVKYIGIFHIRTEVKNQEAISEISRKTNTSGIIDNVRIDHTIKDIDDAISFASTLLDNYGDVRSEITGWISVKQIMQMGLSYDDFSLLKKWVFDLPEFGAVGEYVLVERTISPFILNGGVENLKIQMKFVDRGFLKSYGQIFDELANSIAKLSFREDDIIIEVNNMDEETSLSENYKIDENSGFMAVYCTSEAQFMTDGQLASPTGLSLHAFSSTIGG